jgi:uncharacterized protein
MLYVDASAIVKLHVDEPESRTARSLLANDWVSAGHTLVEVRRALWRTLPGRAYEAARATFAEQWTETQVVHLDAPTCTRAAELAEATGTRTLDALHLAAADRVGDELPFVTFDVRLAAAARSLGWRVLGV